MKQNINIEAEGNELILKNKAGDYVIVPKKYRLEVQDMIKDGCHGCIDNLVETLPVMEDYAQDGSLLPDWDKKYKPYTAVQDNTYVAPKVVMPLELKKKQQFVPREQPVLKADTRTDQERKIAQEYTESVLNPSISTQIGEALQKPLRWVADPVKGIGDVVSAIAPNSALAKALPNTNEETFEHRRKQLNPYISNKEKINSTINEAIPLTNWALLNTLPVGAAASNMIKSGKNLIKPVSKLVNKTDDIVKNLPKLEQVPLDFKIEDVLKNISSTERKNMEIIKKGNAYFRELDNPESLKRLKEFGDEYNIDLLDAYKKAKKRWDYGNNIGKNDRFQVAGKEVFKDDTESALGVSTFDNEGMMKGFLSKDKFADKSLENHSINYVNKKASIKDYDTIVWHELSHDINKNIIGQSTKLQKDLSDIFVKNIDEIDKTKIEAAYKSQKFDTYEKGLVKPKKENMSVDDIAKDELAYISNPTETWAFLSTNLRQDLKNTGIIKNYNELLTPEKLEQAIKNGNTVFSRFEPYIKDKDAFIKLFNKMTLSIAPAALYLQSQNKDK